MQVRLHRFAETQNGPNFHKYEALVNSFALMALPGIVNNRDNVVEILGYSCVNKKFFFSQ